MERPPSRTPTPTPVAVEPAPKPELTPTLRTTAEIRSKGNRLVGQPSPYFEQHGHNPVDWYPWGEEALARARRENRLIFVSVGYSTSCRFAGRIYVMACGLLVVRRPRCCSSSSAPSPATNHCMPKATTRSALRRRPSPSNRTAPVFFAVAIDHVTGRPREVVLTGDADDAESLLDVVRPRGHARLVLARVPATGAEGTFARAFPALRAKTSKDGHATAYVCEMGRGEKPTTDPVVFSQQIARALAMADPR